MGKTEGNCHCAVARLGRNIARGRRSERPISQGRTRQPLPSSFRRTLRTAGVAAEAQSEEARAYDAAAITRLRGLWRERRTEPAARVTNITHREDWRQPISLFSSLSLSSFPTVESLVLPRRRTLNTMFKRAYCAGKREAEGEGKKGATPRLVL